ncbi:C2 domain-containing protein, partial [Dichanthelium oligosanthes]
MDAAELPLVYHIGLVLAALWAAGALGIRHSVLFLIAFLYLYMVAHIGFMYQLLSDAESVRWLNHAINKMWPICMEKIVSQLLRPIIPWFLDKFKPWTVVRFPSCTQHKNTFLQILVGVKFVRSWPFLGRVRLCFVEPPYFQMTVKPLINHGLDVTEFPGISGWLDKLMDTAFGQTLVEVYFLLSAQYDSYQCGKICIYSFGGAVNVSYRQLSPSVIFYIASMSLPSTENNWFSIEERPPIAYVKLEILEGTDMKPSDINGLADPYVKCHLGPFKFQTQIQRKTLSPKWFEEFKIPITSWEASNELVMEVRDKDPMFDDLLGNKIKVCRILFSYRGCTIDLHELRGGQRHDKWISLNNVKKGRIHLAVTVEDVSEDKIVSCLDESLKKADAELPVSTSVDSTLDAAELPEEKKVLMDEVEHINVDGQEQPGGLYVHRPGTGVPKTWESRKGRARSPDTQIYQEVDKSKEVPTPKSSGQGGMFNLGSFFRKNSRKGSFKGVDPSLPPTPASQSVTELDPKLPKTPRPNLKELGEKRTSIKLVVNEEASPSSKVGNADNSTEDVAKVIEKNAGEPGRSLTSTLSRNVSRKRAEDRLSDIPEQIEAHGSEPVSEEPIPVEGEPIEIEGRRTTEHGNGDGAEEDAVLNMRLFPNEKTGKAWDQNGNKPDFHVAMPPAKAKPFYASLVEKFQRSYSADSVKDGIFGAMMKVPLSEKYVVIGFA